MKDQPLHVAPHFNDVEKLTPAARGVSLGERRRGEVAAFGNGVEAKSAAFRCSNSKVPPQTRQVFEPEEYSPFLGEAGAGQHAGDLVGG